jgi:hypothetical protein
MLVGEENWRGAQYIRSWLRGLSHYLYLDEPRTARMSPSRASTTSACSAIWPPPVSTR